MCQHMSPDPIRLEPRISSQARGPDFRSLGTAPEFIRSVRSATFSCLQMPILSLIILSLFGTIWHYLSLFVTLCHSLSLFVTLCHYLSLFVTICHSLSLFVTICHYLPLFVSICHYLSLFGTICHYLSLFVTLCQSLSLFVTICHYCHTVACSSDRYQLMRNGSPLRQLCSRTWIEPIILSFIESHTSPDVASHLASGLWAPLGVLSLAFRLVPIGVTGNCQLRLLMESSDLLGFASNNFKTCSV